MSTVPFVGTDNKTYRIAPRRKAGFGIGNFADIRRHRTSQQVSFMATKINHRITGDKQRLLIVLITRVAEIKKRLGIN